MSNTLKDHINLNQSVDDVDLLDDDAYFGVTNENHNYTEPSTEETGTEEAIVVYEAGEEAEVNLPVEYNGEGFEITFNVNYLLEAISSYDAETVKMLMDQPISPVLIVSDEETELKNVIMPMKV